MCGSGPAARCDLHGRVLPTSKEIMTGRTRQQQGRQQQSLVVIWVLRVKDFNMCEREKPFAPIHLAFPLAIYIHPCDFHNVTNLEEQKRQNQHHCANKKDSLHYITNAIYPKTKTKFSLQSVDLKIKYYRDTRYHQHTQDTSQVASIRKAASEHKATTINKWSRIYVVTNK